MKKILKMLVLGLLSAALLCCALPSAFAAEQKDAQIYTIGLDAMGGTSSVVAVTTNLNGKLSALPAQPTLDGYTIRPPKVKLLKAEGQSAKFRVTIHEGRNRQVRRMCDAAGMHCTRLRRIQEGSLRLGDLPLGKWRYLTEAEVAGLVRTPGTSGTI